jgi:hypothetical protein
MSYKISQCQNPKESHLKIIYGNMLNEFETLRCECGYPFNPVYDSFKDFSKIESLLNEMYFENVDPEDETKIFPKI